MGHPGSVFYSEILKTENIHCCLRNVAPKFSLPLSKDALSFLERASQDHYPWASGKEFQSGLHMFSGSPVLSGYKASDLWPSAQKPCSPQQKPFTPASNGLRYPGWQGGLSSVAYAHSIHSSRCLLIVFTVRSPRGAAVRRYQWGLPSDTGIPGTRRGRTNCKRRNPAIFVRAEEPENTATMASGSPDWLVSV